MISLEPVQGGVIDNAAGQFLKLMSKWKDFDDVMSGQSGQSQTSGSCVVFLEYRVSTCSSSLKHSAVLFVQFINKCPDNSRMTSPYFKPFTGFWTEKSPIIYKLTIPAAVASGVSWVVR